jgi:hypothetical protein
LMRRGAGSDRLSSPFRFVPRGDDGACIVLFCKTRNSFGVRALRRQIEGCGDATRRCGEGRRWRVLTWLGFPFGGDFLVGVQRGVYGKCYYFSDLVLVSPNSLFMSCNCLRTASLDTHYKNTADALFVISKIVHKLWDAYRIHATCY